MRATGSYYNDVHPFGKIVRELPKGCNVGKLAYCILLSRPYVKADVAGVDLQRKPIHAELQPLYALRRFSPESYVAILDVDEMLG